MMVSLATPAVVPAGLGALPADYWALLKPRVMSLVVFTALVGLIAAPGGVNPVVGFTAILATAVGAGASGALNMWWEADIDARMRRTANRPIPAGRLAAGDALAFGGVLALMSIMVMALGVGWLAAAWLAGTIFFYVVVYTMWLKPRTPHNIVIGGAAGAFPPIIGWVAATGEVTALPLILFALIFLWTPPHFWALALFTRGDYANAGIPMLPVVAGEAATRRQILYYSVALALASIAPVALGLVGLIYTVPAAILGIMFVALAVRVARNRATEPAAMRPEKRLFRFSLLYLFLLFAAVAADQWAA